MSDIVSLVGIVVALSVGTMSPGPSFVVVARTAVAKSRVHGVSAALGMGLGGMMFAGFALLGLQGVLLAVPSLYIALKVLGGLYLCYLAFRLYRAANDPLEIKLTDSVSSEKLSRSFIVGFVTQVSNPKTAIVYTSVFAAFLPSSVSATLGVAILVSVFAIETGWYSIVAVALAASKPREIYLAYKAWVDRVAGFAIGALGLKLVFSHDSALP